MRRLEMGERSSLVVGPQPFLTLYEHEPLANRSCASHADLDAVLGTRCVTRAQRPDLIRSYTRYHWWPPHA